MMPPEEMSPLEPADEELIAGARRGDRDAFGRIVGRYQALICALAYNATGHLAQSEDLAQEAFVVAWKQLPALREPEKLRSWLCGIVRNLARRARRDGEHEPVHRAEPLESAGEVPAPGPHPLDQAISREEEGILWRQLEAIPETYREPLILFYRQHASTEQVALALELSEDAVRQRLTRGRRLLQEQVRVFVESALERTSPKPAFTQSVLAALPAAASSGKAVGAALAAASGSAAKGAWAAAGPIGGVLAMLGGAFVSRRAIATDDTKSPREKEFVARFAWIQVAAAIAFIVAFLMMTAREIRAPHPPFVRDIGGAALVFLFWVIGMGLWRLRYRRQFQIQREDNTLDESEWGLQRWRTGREANPPRSGPSFSLLLRRSAISLIFSAIMAFKAPWRHHFALALGCYVALPLLSLLLVTFLMHRMFKKGRRFQRPPLSFLCGFPAAVTLLIVDLDFFSARARGAISVPQILWLNAAVILAYAIWAACFVRKSRPSVRRAAS